MKSTSMQDIANKLGITRTLVHMALSNKYGVSEATRSLIITTALDMGYDFNRIKKTSHKRPKVTLLLMQWDLKSNTFWNEIVCAIEQKCTQLNLNMTIKIWDENNVENQLRSSLFDDQTQGVIALNHFPIDTINKCEQMKIPAVLIDSSKYFGCKYNHVRINNYTGGYSAAEFLYSCGHKNLLFVGYANYAFSLKERYRGFKDFIMTYNDINCEYIIDEPQDIMKLYDTDVFIEKYKELSPTAIMCINDAVAKNIYTDLRKFNVKIGEDVSVMTFDCSVETEFLTPKITGIYFDKQQLGFCAVELLNELLSNPDTITKTVMLPANVLERNSVKKI